MGNLITPTEITSRAFATDTSSFDNFVALTVDRQHNKGSLVLDDKGGLKCVGHHFWKLAANWGSSSTQEQEKPVREQFQKAVDTELLFHFDALLVQDAGKSNVEGLKEKFDAIKAIFDDQIQHGGEGRSREFNRMAIGKIAQNVRWFVNNMSVERLLNMSPQDLASLATNKSARQQAEKLGGNEVDAVKNPTVEQQQPKFSKVFDQLKGLQKSGRSAGEVVKCVHKSITLYINQELYDYTMESSGIGKANKTLLAFNDGLRTRQELESAVDENLLKEELWQSSDELKNARTLVAALKSQTLKPGEFVTKMGDVFRNELSARRKSICGKYNAIFEKHGINTLAFQESKGLVVLDVKDKDQPLSGQTLDELKKLLNIFDVNEGENGLHEALGHGQINPRFNGNNGVFIIEGDLTSTVISKLEEKLAELSAGDSKAGGTGEAGLPSNKVNTTVESDSAGKVDARSDSQRRSEIVSLLKTADKVSQTMDKLKGFPITSVIEAAKDTLLVKINSRHEVSKALDDVTMKLFNCQNQLDRIFSKPKGSENPALDQTEKKVTSDMPKQIGSLDKIDADKLNEEDADKLKEEDADKLKENRIVFNPQRVADEVKSMLQNKVLTNCPGKDKMLARISTFEKNWPKSEDQAETARKFISDMLTLTREASAGIASSLTAMNETFKNHGITRFAFSGKFRVNFGANSGSKNFDEKAIQDFQKLIDAFTGKDMKFRTELGFSITNDDAKNTLLNFNRKLEELSKQPKLPPKTTPANINEMTEHLEDEMFENVGSFDP